MREPLVKGGQGRTASDVTLAAISAAVLLGVGILGLAAIVIGVAVAAAGV